MKTIDAWFGDDGTIRVRCRLEQRFYTMGSPEHGVIVFHPTGEQILRSKADHRSIVIGYVIGAQRLLFANVPFTTTRLGDDVAIRFEVPEWLM